MDSTPSHDDLAYGWAYYVAHIKDKTRKRNITRALVRHYKQEDDLRKKKENTEESSSK